MPAGLPEIGPGFRPSHSLGEGTDLDGEGSRRGCGHLPHPRGSPSVEPLGTCAGHPAAVLGLRKASLLQAALQEAVVVGSPGPGLCPFRGGLAVQAHVEAPGAREVVWGWQARASSPWALLVFQALGAQGAVPLGTQLIRGELGGRGRKWWVLGRVSARGAFSHSRVT